MEIKIKPVSGCLQIVLGVFTLGVAPLAVWISQRMWPKSADEQGLITRAGTRIAWDEFSGFKKVITQVGRTAFTTEHYELRGSKGKVIVAPYRLENGSQVFDYIWQRLPQHIRETQP